MKVTLIYPGIAQVGFGSLGRGTPSTHLAGLGLAYLGAAVRERSSHAVDLIDLREMRGWEHFAEALAGRNSDVVGIHVNTVNVDFAMKCAEIARGLGKKVIGGGPHATIAPGDFVASGFFDHVLVGEGEITFPKILDGIAAGREVPSVIPGEPVPDLDGLPFPDRDLYNMGKILGGPGVFPYPHRYIGIITSRGCPFNCAFCQPLERNLFGRKVRQRSVANVMGEVELVKRKYGANFIMFQDSVLTIRKSWTRELCGEMRKTGIPWGCQTRVDTVDEETIRALREGGCAVIMFGFESGSERILKLLGKDTTPGQALEAARLCRKHDIMIFANYMLGIPTETPEDLQATLDLLREIRPEIHAQSYFSPIPGSALFDYCRERDLIAADSYESLARSSLRSKVKGIDYEALGPMRRRMERFRTPWYRRKSFSRCLFKRWSGLLKEGLVIQWAKEALLSTPWLGDSLRRALRTAG